MRRDVTDRIIWKELKNGVSIVISLVCLGAMEVDSFPLGHYLEFLGVAKSEFFLLGKPVGKYMFSL